ncbi:MAG: molybdenum cofactor guanylyltransferase [Flavobacteriales bacterium]|nr:molybdenum cofactor guanylyltransferase [Flavobacteriales bacterium]
MATTGIILAGGKSSRMGQDKGLMPFRGKPMVQHVIDAAAMVCNSFVLVTDHPIYSMFGFPVMADEVKGFGPVAGILSGLRRSATDRNLVLSCDVPFVTPALLKELVLCSADADVIVAEGPDGRMHPLIAVYSKSCIAAFAKAVDSDEHRLRTVLESLEVHCMAFGAEMETQLRNVNSQKDFQNENV